MFVTNQFQLTMHNDFEHTHIDATMLDKNTRSRLSCEQLLLMSITILDAVN